MSVYKVEICGVNTSKLPILTNAEKEELFDKIEQGDMTAREQFINGNLRLVLSIIQRFNNASENVDDLFQIGCIGLIKALDNFDRSLNVKFSTYAVPMIIGEIRRYLRDNNTIRVSRSLKDIAYKALKVKEELTNRLGKEPSVSMIAQILNIPEFEVTNAIDSMKETISMFEPIYNDGGDTIYLEDQLSNEKDLIDKENIISLKGALNRIDKRERSVLYARCIYGKTQLEIAADLGVSQAQVSRIEKNAINDMRRLLK